MSKEAPKSQYPRALEKGKSLMAVLMREESYEARREEAVERHLEYQEGLRARLSELREQIRSRNYTLEILNEYDEVYSAYLDSLTKRTSPNRRGILSRLLHPS